jgi:hypothetical protein
MALLVKTYQVNLVNNFPPNLIQYFSIVTKAKLKYKRVLLKLSGELFGEVVKELGLAASRELPHK